MEPPDASAMIARLVDEHLDPETADSIRPALPVLAGAVAPGEAVIWLTDGEIDGQVGVLAVTSTAVLFVDVREDLTRIELAELVEVEARPSDEEGEWWSVVLHTDAGTTEVRDVGEEEWAEEFADVVWASVDDPAAGMALAEQLDESAALPPVAPGRVGLLASQLLEGERLADLSPALETVAGTAGAGDAVILLTDGDVHAPGILAVAPGFVLFVDNNGRERLRWPLDDIDELFGMPGSGDWWGVVLRSSSGEEVEVGQVGDEAWAGRIVEVVETARTDPEAALQLADSG